MSADKNSLFAAAIIVSGAVAATLGMVARDRVDLPRFESVATGQLPGTRIASAQEPKGIDIPEREYFEQLVEMLKQGYVEPIDDEQKLVTGAVRGMVSSLEDPNSLFFDKDEFKVFQNAREGQYEGIGVDLIYSMPPKSTDPNAQEGRIPRLVVAAVTKGGPADKAGLKAGDVIDSVDGRWIVNLEILDQFREMQKAVEEKKATPEEFRKFRNDVRAKSEHSMLPPKARDRLVAGSSGTVKVAYVRAGKTVEATLQKGPSSAKPVESAGGVLAVRLMPGVGGQLSKALPASGVTTLDLRNNALADLATVTEALEALGTKGSYGKLVNQRGGAWPVTVKAGRTGAPKYKLIVDESTRGGAAMLASALKAKGLASIEGVPSSDQTAVEVVRLPDGSGFTLSKGTLKPEVAK